VRQLQQGLRILRAQPADGRADGLASLREGFVDDSPQSFLADVDGWVIEAGDADDRRRHRRARPEHLSWHRANHLDGRSVRDPDARRPVVPRARCRAEPIRDLPLHRHDETFHHRRALEHIEHDGGPDVVGEVPATNPRAAVEHSGPCHLRRICREHLDRGPIRNHRSERREQRPVELDREHARRARVGECHRQRPQPRADLDDPIPGTDTGVVRDRLREVRVGEEMLPERACR
jgi:hypothetical protein